MDLNLKHIIICQLEFVLKMLWTEQLSYYYYYYYLFFYGYLVFLIWVIRFWQVNIILVGWIWKKKKKRKRRSKRWGVRYIVKWGVEMGKYPLKSNYSVSWPGFKTICIISNSSLRGSISRPKIEPLRLGFCLSSGQIPRGVSTWNSSL